MLLLAGFKKIATRTRRYSYKPVLMFSITICTNFHDFHTRTPWNQQQACSNHHSMMSIGQTVNYLDDRTRGEFIQWSVWWWLGVVRGEEGSEGIWVMGLWGQSQNFNLMKNTSKHSLNFVPNLMYEFRGKQDFFQVYLSTLSLLANHESSSNARKLHLTCLLWQWWFEISILAMIKKTALW